MSPAFALTEYKVQGATYKNAVLDLHQKSKPRGEDASHKCYCSFYVQLSRLESLKGLTLLEPLTLADITFKMHRKLREEDNRLEKLATQTMLKLSN